MAEILLEVNNLRTTFDTSRGPLKAVDGVSYNIERGEIVALVGESGCGKTVSALSLIHLIPQPPGRISGEAWFEGKELIRMDSNKIHHIRGAHIAVIFQEPMTSLNPVYTIGRQVGEGMLKHHRATKKDVDDRSAKLLAKVGIPEGKRRLGQYPGQFSGGMRQRVMISMALACEPSLIIADEPTTAVDVTIQAQLLELLDSIIKQTNSAVLLITHNLGIVAKYARRINVMYAGRIVEQGLTDEIFYEPSHPYTQALLGCVPRLDEMKGSHLTTIEGQPPDLVNRSPACAFAPRCPSAQEACQDWPPLRRITDTHSAACVLVKEAN